MSCNLHQDPPFLALGFPPVEGAYIPLADSSIPPEGIVEAFNIWVSGFFDHGEAHSGETLELGKPPASLSSTFKTLTTEQRHSVLDPVPADPRGGSDITLMNAGTFSGAFAALREEALRHHAAAHGLGMTFGGWDAVEVRHVWCDASPWPMSWAAMCLQEEIAGKRKAGCSVRDVSFTRVRGANHLVGALWTELTEFCRMFTFLQVHWEEPERVLKAFLA